MDNNIVIKKQWFIKSQSSKIEDAYEFDHKKLLGQGTYGQVVKAKLKGSKQQRAIKIIPKNKVRNPERFRREIEIMRNLDHPNIIKLFETFEDVRNVYLVMELCEGGELFDRIIDKGHFSENEAKIIFLQIMQAVNYCHQNGICHRDLKPENFLMLTKADDSPLKVIDFGLSVIFHDNHVEKLHQGKVSMTTRAGTPYYISPEILDGKYDESCDIWSAGVILYILISGVPPFYGNTDPEILDAVKKGVFTFNIPEFKKVSDSCKDLISKMICKPEKRIKSHDVLTHPWMKQQHPAGSFLSVNYQSLKNFTNFNRLKKVTLTYIASQLSEQEITELGKLFKQLDKNGDGVLTMEELTHGLTGLKKESQNEIMGVIKSIDTDGSGAVNYTEFLAATIEKSVYMKQEKLFQAFKMFDLDGSGKISRDELKQVLGSNNPGFDDNALKALVKDADKDGDGEIDYNEFIEMMDKMKS
ncbi:unnamed protein product (macronuclear) [Paramecium tetraurelia]|uniref:Calcium-dependent protein kinase 1 n=1 Tax=Paramecium tetraurelia TaxID=5888 RepID=A0CB50_PARTE|nr:uncharacterized protein GSPATT00036800001 [Paramecium tetraurelia]CAK68017.1 unnamed protein product [Paramecium tetraurelia]|eukprot:XP_001435414.1 hypothetical protein (macronuclear) [Paramecium tetraurelia strain d4-2]